VLNLDPLVGGSGGVLGTPSVGIGTKPRAYWLGGLGKRYEVPSGVWGGAPAARHFLIVSMLNLVNLKVYIYTTVSGFLIQQTL